MGLALGVEAATGIAEGAEAAAAATSEAGEGIIASGEDAEGLISSGGEAGAEAGTEAGTQAGSITSKVGDALATAFKTLQTSLSKMGKMVEDYIIMDAVFKSAKEILQGHASDPGVRARLQKLGKLVPVLTESISLVKNIASWLQAHAKDTVTLAGQQVPVDQGVLAKFLAPLGAAAKTLDILSKQVTKRNKEKKPVTDGEVEALRKGLITVLASLLELAKFKESQEGTVQVLKYLPVESHAITGLQSQVDGSKSKL